MKGKPIASALIIRTTNLKPDFKDYFRTSLADFYVSPAHRWLAYTVIFILSGLGAFGALWLYDLGYGIDYYNDIPLAFKGMYAWHTATNFAVCWLIMDMLITLAPRAWGAFNQRTVGKTWLIFLIVFPIGFALQRTVVYQMVDLYYPKWILRHEMYPAERPDSAAMFLFMLAFWLVIGYVTMRIILSLQERSEELLRVRIDTILEERSHPAIDSSRDAKERPDGDDPVSLPFPSGVGPITPSQIGHITSEDHYLRIHYHSNGRCRETLIRMSLKELTSRLPPDRFIRIHRSHIVSLKWIAGVKRAGREVRLIMKHGDFNLPVSRYRLPQILPVLDRFLGQDQHRLN